MTNHIGNRFYIHKFHGCVWTHEGTRKMIQSNGSTVIKLPETTSGIPRVLACCIKIRPGGNLEVPLECTRKLTNHMDIRIDTGFHHKNPNVYITPSCINNPNNQYNPKYMPLTIFNLSKVDHLYIGRDTMVTFAEEPTIDTYHIEVAGEEKIKEHLAKPRNWVPKDTRHYLKSHLILLLFVLQQMYQVAVVAVVTFAEEPTIDTYHIEVASEEKIKEHLAKPCNWVFQRHETLPEIPPDTAFI